MSNTPPRRCVSSKRFLVDVHLTIIEDGTRVCGFKHENQLSTMVSAKLTQEIHYLISIEDFSASLHVRYLIVESYDMHY